MSAIPVEPGWLAGQARVVIAYGEEGAVPNADVVVEDKSSAQKLASRVQASPLAALTLVQVLRSGEQLPASLALDVESLAYATLQGGPEFAAWLAQRSPPASPVKQDGPAIVMDRREDSLYATLNRPGSRNAITLEMRDALVELLQVLEADPAIRELRLNAKGACFSVGGELGEFGTTPDTATAHWVRTVHSPARLMSRLGSRINCHVHGACIGSGIELAAFAGHLAAHPKSFFHLPELQLGLIPGAGGTVSIARRIGRQRTAWLVLSGKRINAAKALEWGLVDAISDELA